MQFTKMMLKAVEVLQTDLKSRGQFDGEWTLQADSLGDKKAESNLDALSQILRQKCSELDPSFVIKEPVRSSQSCRDLVEQSPELSYPIHQKSTQTAVIKRATTTTDIKVLKPDEFFSITDPSIRSSTQKLDEVT